MPCLTISTCTHRGNNRTNQPQTFVHLKNSPWRHQRPHPQWGNPWPDSSQQVNSSLRVPPLSILVPSQLKSLRTLLSRKDLAQPHMHRQGSPKRNYRSLKWAESSGRTWCCHREAAGHPPEETNRIWGLVQVLITRNSWRAGKLGKMGQLIVLNHRLLCFIEKELCGIYFTYLWIS